MRIESDMNSEDIQKFFNAYVKHANPTAVCSRLIDALAVVLKGRNLNGNDPEVELILRFRLELDSLHLTMSELEEKLLDIPTTRPEPPLL